MWEEKTENDDAPSQQLEVTLSLLVEIDALGGVHDVMPFGVPVRW